jgi:hypothetical protein
MLPYLCRWIKETLFKIMLKKFDFISSIPHLKSGGGVTVIKKTFFYFQKSYVSVRRTVRDNLAYLSAD